MGLEDDFLLADADDEKTIAKRPSSLSKTICLKN